MYIVLWPRWEELCTSVMSSHDIEVAIFDKRMQLSQSSHYRCYRFIVFASIVRYYLFRAGEVIQRVVQAWDRLACTSLWCHEELSAAHQTSRD